MNISIRNAKALYLKFSRFLVPAILMCAGLFVILAVTHTGRAQAVPGLSISKTVAGKPLLGGTASYTITVTNTSHTDKGYNLSISDVFSSSRTNPQGKITLVSATDSRGALPPTSVVTDSGTGDTTIKFDNIKDLAEDEVYTINLVVSLASDPTWQVGDALVNNVTGTIYSVPDGSGAPITGTSSLSANVIPIKLVNKTANQSTGVEQDLGTLDRPYSYTLDIQNNYVNTTNAVGLTDTIPDGVEYLGMISGAAPTTVTRNPATGVTTLVWALGNFAAGQHSTLSYRSGIRYDYYGTDNGGTNRTHNDFDGTPATGTPIPNKTTFLNTAGLTATYLGNPYTDSATASVTGAYATISKSATPGSGGNGTTIHYTLTYSSAEYYNVVENDADSIVIHDHLPDGQTYSSDASPAPSSVVNNADGSTDIYWDPTVLSGLDHSSQFGITFSSTVDNTWTHAPYGGLKIVSGDHMTNTADSAGQWEDQVTEERTGTTASADSASFSTGLPGISKEIQDPVSGLWVDSVTATVGDTLNVRVRFNTSDGANPIRSDINFGNITVTDWLPPGTTYNSDAVSTYSNAGDFVDHDAGNPPVLNVSGPPTNQTIGGLDGIEWYLGDVTQGGWWQAIFTVKVADVASVTEGATVNNLFKLTGLNTFEETYSDRDAAAINFTEPTLTVAKDATSVPSPLVPNSVVGYTINIANTGTAAAKNVLINDTLPVGMRTTMPAGTVVKLNGVTLTLGVNYTLAYDAGTGIFTIDYTAGAIPVGQALVITYNSAVDSTNPAGLTLTDTASVTYSSQSSGTRRNYGPVTDPATVTLDSVTIAKSLDGSTPAPFKIGDTIKYNLNVTVPGLTVAYWPRVLDTLNRDGFAYVPSSATLTNISGSPLTAAFFDILTNPDPQIGGTGTTTTLSWNLNDFTNPIDNRGSVTDYVFRLSFSVKVTGLEDNGTTWEFWTPGANDQVTNSATINWNTTNPGVRATNKSSGSNNVISQIVQPYLGTTKTLNNHTGVGGDTVTATVVVRNNGTSTAYENDTDYDFVDTVPPGFINTTLTSVTSSTNSLLSSPADYTATFTGNDLQIEYNSSLTDLAPDATLTFVYTMQVDPAIGGGAVLHNSADVDYSSQPGVFAGERIVNDTYAGEGTADTSSDTFTVASSSITKTSDAPANKASIGDTFTYSVTASVPLNTTSYNSTLTDVVPDGLTVLGTSTSAPIGAVVTGPEVNGATTVTWNIGDVSNPSVSQLILYIQVRVDDTYYNLVPLDGLPVPADGDAQDLLHNTASLGWDDADTGGSHHTSGTAYDVTVTEPHITQTKTVDPAIASSGDPVQYTITVSNNGTATAYDIDWQDAIPAELFNAGVSPTLVSVTHNTSGALTAPANFASSFSVNPVTIDFHGTSTNPHLAPGESITIVYNANVQVGLPYGRVLTNTATVNHYSNHDGPDPNERVRGPVNTSQNLPVDVPVLITDKSVVGDGTPQRGGTVTYRYTIQNVGNATANAVNITDTLPSPGFSYVAGTTAATWSGGSSTADPAVIGSGLSWSFSATVNAGQTMILTFNALVGDTATYGDQTNTAAADGVDPWGFDIHKDGGTLDTDKDDLDTADVTVTNPSVAIAKHLIVGQDTIVQVGNPIAYDLTITNNGTTTISTLPLRDTYDQTKLTYVGATPSSIDTVNDGVIDWTDITATQGDLAPGNSVTVRVNFTAAATGTQIPDTAVTRGATDVNGDAVPDVSATDNVISITRPSVAITKTLADGYVSNIELDQPVLYDVTITNTGDTTLDLISLSDTYDTHYLSFLGADPAPNDLADDGLLNWTDLTPALGNLAPGNSLTVQTNFNTVAVGNEVGNLANVVTAIDANGDAATPVSAAQDINIFDLADVDILKTATPAEGTTLLPGEIITYNIHYANNTAVTLNHLVFSDPLGPSVDYVLDSITLNGTPLTDAASDDAGEFNTSSKTVLIRLDQLISGGSGDYSFQARVRPDEFSKAGVANRVTMTSDEIAGTDSNQVVHSVNPIDITKSGIDVNGGLLVPGDEILWTITVKNIGIVPTTHVVVTDTVPAHTSYVAGSITGIGAKDAGNPNLEWDVGTLAVDQSVDLTFRTTLTDVPADSEIKNQAKVVSDQSREKLSDDASTLATDDATVLLAQTGQESRALIIGLFFALAIGIVLLLMGIKHAKRIR